MNTKSLFIISGPAGSGKDSVIDQLPQYFPIERIITTTSRLPRPNESEGHPYHFISREAFEQNIRQGVFIEHSVNENNEYYGITQADIERALASQRVTIWKLDWKGVMSVKKIFPEIPAIMITLPDLASFEKRLRLRDTNQPESYFTERMTYTKEWLTHTDIYDSIVTNHEGKLDETVQKVAEIIRRHQALS